jgi:hypothetical protein
MSEVNQKTEKRSQNSRLHAPMPVMTLEVLNVM